MSSPAEVFLPKKKIIQLLMLLNHGCSVGSAARTLFVHTLQKYLFMFFMYVLSALFGSHFFMYALFSGSLQLRSLSSIPVFYSGASDFFLAILLFF